MDIIRAKEIVSALAEGIDPTTGEILPEDSIYNKGDVVRALYAVLKHLNEKTSNGGCTENAGKPWPPEEDEQLRTAYRNGLKVSDLTKMHKRTRGAIKARLVKLGEVETKKDAK